MLPALLLLLSQPKTLILAHYMPWFEAKPVHKEWGWHWTMGKTNPDVEDNGRRQIAAHSYPMIGAYDSADPDVLEYQTLLMKISGMDGVLIDWYGTADLYDYASNHQTTLKMIAAAKKAGLKFGIVYEDATVNNLIEKGVWKKEDALSNGKDLMEWVSTNWLSSPSYITFNGVPPLFVFGPQHYKEDEWPQLLGGLANKPSLLCVHYARKNSDGAYDWPLPGGGTEGSDKHLDDFYKAGKDLKISIPAAFPRFHDYYGEAGMKSYGTIGDREGKTFEMTLDRALASKPPAVQVATWNDWGEGTQIEPSLEFGYRDLEATQRLRRKYLGAFPYSPTDLRLPQRLFNLRKSGAPKAALDKAFTLILKGKGTEAGKALAKLEGT